MKSSFTKGMKLTPEDMAANIAHDSPQRFHIGMGGGQLEVEYYIPKREDLQKPHDRDECYVVTRGSGQFMMGNRVVDVKAGDFLRPQRRRENRMSAGLREGESPAILS